MVTSFVLSFLPLFLDRASAPLRKSRGTARDYYLADQSVLPLLVGLSAVATNNKRFINGLSAPIGYTYCHWPSSVWLMVWLDHRDFSVFICPPKLRESGASQANLAMQACSLIGGWSSNY